MSCRKDSPSRILGTEKAEENIFDRLTKIQKLLREGKFTFHITRLLKYEDDKEFAKVIQKQFETLSNNVDMLFHKLYHRY